MGKFVDLEADAVSEMVGHGGVSGGLEVFVNGAEDVAAFGAGFGDGFNDAEGLDDVQPGLHLGVGGMVVDGEGAAVVGVVASELGAEVEDVELAVLGGAVVAGGASGASAGVVVAGDGGEFFTGGFDGGVVESGIDVEFVDAGLDDLLGAGVHGLGAADGGGHEAQFIGVFDAAHLPEVGIDGFGVGFEIDQELGVDLRGVGSDAFGAEALEGMADLIGDDVGLLLAEGGDPLGFEAGDVVGGDVVGGLVGGGEPGAAVGGDDEGGTVEAGGEEAGEIVDVGGIGADGGVELAGGEDFQQAGLSVAAVGYVEHGGKVWWWGTGCNGA